MMYGKCTSSRYQHQRNNAENRLYVLFALQSITIFQLKHTAFNFQMEFKRIRAFIEKLNKMCARYEYRSSLNMKYFWTISKR